MVIFSTSAERKQAIAENPAKFNKQASFKFKNLLPQEKKDLKKCQAPVKVRVNEILQEAEKIFQKVQKLVSRNIYNCY